LKMWSLWCAAVELFATCAVSLAALDTNSADADSLAFFVPGRIEVLGKHTDYAGGRSLLCAMERGFAVLARPRTDAVVRAVDRVDAITARSVPAGPSGA